MSPAFAMAYHGKIVSVYQKIGAVTSPDDKIKDVPWLQLDEIQEGPHGGISTVAHRLQTAGGQPPASVSEVLAAERAPFP